MPQSNGEKPSKSKTQDKMNTPKNCTSKARGRVDDNSAGSGWHAGGTSCALSKAPSSASGPAPASSRAAWTSGARRRIVECRYIAVPASPGACNFERMSPVALPTNKLVPPSSGKSTSTGICRTSVPRTWAQISAIACSIGVSGSEAGASPAAGPSPTSAVGSGSLFRSTLPLAFRGKTSSCTMLCGCMYFGKRLPHAALTAASGVWPSGPPS
mmetsp:Transcript_82514/g.252161  ORF Transcript_82514/g.252161 Transcript_82514/m.252161 type:complete len:213 (-) Transcript_82514:81-719(-)